MKVKNMKVKSMKVKNMKVKNMTVEKKKLSKINEKKKLPFPHRESNPGHGGESAGS